MNQNFIQPRFIGTRFESNTLPLDATRDLIAYEALLIELAKRLFLHDHPERQRVPKGFTDVHLAIVSVEKGSAKPVLALIAATALSATSPQLSLFDGEISPSNENAYFTQARDLIAECIAAPDSALPEQFPKELLTHFNQLGRSLREGEALELPRKDTAQKAVLNPEKRKSLVLAANRVYEREVELSGFIEEGDWSKDTFRLRLSDGSQATLPMSKNFHDMIRQSGGRDRDYVFFKGIATYDSLERLQKVLNVESIEVIKNFPLAVQFEELAQLENGWYESQGIAPDANKLKGLSQKLTDLYPEYLPLPTIVPKQDGNLLLEWDADGDPSTDIDLGSMMASFHAFGLNGEDIEGDFPLSASKDFEPFFAFLSANIKPRSS